MLIVYILATMLIVYILGTGDYFTSGGDMHSITSYFTRSGDIQNIKASSQSLDNPLKFIKFFIILLWIRIKFF